MNIFINGKELSVMLENEKNAYEILKITNAKNY